jgi:hypothetical protein
MARYDIHYMAWHSESERWECHHCGLLEQADSSGEVIRVIRRPDSGWRSSHVRELKLVSRPAVEPLPRRNESELPELPERMKICSVLDQLWLGSVGILWDSPIDR